MEVDGKRIKKFINQCIFLKKCIDRNLKEESYSKIRGVLLLALDAVS